MVHPTLPPTRHPLDATCYETTSIITYQTNPVQPLPTVPTSHHSGRTQRSHGYRFCTRCIWGATFQQNSTSTTTLQFHPHMATSRATTKGSLDSLETDNTGHCSEPTKSSWQLASSWFPVPKMGPLVQTTYGHLSHHQPRSSNPRTPSYMQRLHHHRISQENHHRKIIWNPQGATGFPTRFSSFSAAYQQEHLHQAFK